MEAIIQTSASTNGTYFPDPDIWYILYSYTETDGKNRIVEYKENGSTRTREMRITIVNDSVKDN